MHGIMCLLDGWVYVGLAYWQHQDAKRPKKKTGAGWSPQRAPPALFLLSSASSDRVLLLQGVDC